MASELRTCSNAVLRVWLPELAGRVANFGAGSGLDKQGRLYAAYCSGAKTYTAIDVRGNVLRADITRMPQVPSESFDGGLCLWVLEHVPDVAAAMREMGRVLQPGAPLIVGVPLRYRLHGTDYWRFGLSGLKALARGWDEDALEALGPAYEPVVMDPKLRFFGTPTEKGPLGWLIRLRKRR